MRMTKRFWFSNNNRDFLVLCVSASFCFDSITDLQVTSKVQTNSEVK